MEELGLAPNLSRLSKEDRDLIRRGNGFRRRSRREAWVSACAAMAQAGFGTDEIWIVMTDARNGISQQFYEGGESAEDHLESIIGAALSRAVDG